LTSVQGRASFSQSSRHLPVFFWRLLDGWCNFYLE
jgi:hypothetical protein